MADSTVIEKPLTSGATDNPDAPQSGASEHGPWEDYGTPEQKQQVQSNMQEGPWQDYKTGEGAAAAAPKPASAPAEEKPGYFKRLGQSLGLPTSEVEIEAANKESASLPGFVKTAAGPVGTIYGMGADYLKKAYQGIKEGAGEVAQAYRNVGEGGPVGQNVGKALYGAGHAAAQAVPFVGPPTETMGQDIAAKNYRGAAGGATGVAAQLIAAGLGKAPEGAPDTVIDSEQYNPRNLPRAESTPAFKGGERQGITPGAAYVPPTEETVTGPEQFKPEHQPPQPVRTTALVRPKPVALAPSETAVGAEQFAPENLPAQPVRTTATIRPRAVELPTRETVTGPAQFAPENLPEAKPTTAFVGGERQGTVPGKAYVPPAAEGPITSADVKSTPGTSMSPEGKEVTAGEERRAGERRQDVEKRKQVEEMSPEEMKKELLTSQTTNLPNKRAFEEGPKSKAVAMSDADGLKALNDKYGYEAGNALLKAKAEALKEAGLEAYHDKGDEFLYKGESPEDLNQKLEKAREILRNREITATMTDGTTKTFKGADFSHGTAEDLNGAETKLKAHKAEREASGERKRGELRGITETGPKEGGVDNGKAEVAAQLAHHEANGGSTFSAEGRNMHGSGKYVVGSYPERTEILDNLTPETLRAFKNKNADLLSKPDHTVGTWKDNETGKHVVDISKTYDDRAEAIAAGKAANQKSIYHLTPEGEEIKTGGTGEALPAAEAAKAEAEKPAAEPKAVPEAPTADETLRASKLIKDHGDQNLIKAATQYDIDHGKYDFSKRTLPTETSSGRARYERDALAKDVAEKMEKDKPGITDELLKAQDGFDNEDSGMFSSADRSGASRAERAKAVWDKAHENWEAKYGAGPTEAQLAAKMSAKGPAPEGTAETAKMSNEELLKKGFTQEDIDAGLQFPKGEGGGKVGVTALPEDLSKYLSKKEVEGITKSEQGRNTAVKKLMALPDVQEFTDIALKGEGGRKWYQRSRQAFTALSKALPEYFKEPGDQEKFTDLLAAGSPQQSVKMNLQEALKVWTKYVDNDRPVGKPLEDLLSKEFTLPGAKTPNAMKALAGEDLWPDISKNKNFKVPSFAANLRGWLDHVTSDGWQGLFGGIDPKELSSPTSYHPLAAATRAAAEALGWEPAEAQAAIWAFTKAFTEGLQKGMSAEEAGVPDYVKQYSQDFADIIANDKDIQQQLQELGVNKETLDDYLSKVEPKPEVTGRTTATSPSSVARLNERIKEARELPAPKDQGNLDLKEVGTEFNPEELEGPKATTVEFPKAAENLGRNKRKIKK